MARASHVDYRVSTASRFFIIGFAVLLDLTGLLLFWTGIVPEILGFLGSIIFLLWFLLLGINYLSGRSLQKIGVIGVCSVIEMIPFLNGFSPTFTIETVVLIRISRKEDEEKAKKAIHETAKTHAIETQRQRYQMNAVARRRAVQAANDSAQTQETEAA